ITQYRSNRKTIKSKHAFDEDYIPDLNDLYSGASDSNYDSSSSNVDIRTTEVVHGNDSGCINEIGPDVKVYKKFFLATLGYTLKNDRRLRNIITMNNTVDLQPRPVKLGHPSSKRIDGDIIIENINSFHSQISHYRKARST
ncbi:hypothetical protein ILUMI_05594, partial [Ignelater luminosus]